MKILVIDNTEQLAANLANSGTEMAVYADEILGLNAAEQQPPMIMLNYALRGESSPDYIRLLLTTAPAASLVVVGENLPEEAVFHCLLAGAKGYQEFRTLPDYLERLMLAISRGEAWVSRKMVSKLLDALRERGN